jgi:hypothetical protein
MLLMMLLLLLLLMLHWMGVIEALVHGLEQGNNESNRIESKLYLRRHIIH